MTKKLLLDSLWTVVTRFVMKGANLVVFVILARQLGLAEFGFYGYVVAITLLLSTFLDFGTRHSAGYYLGSEPHKSDEIILQTHIWCGVFSVVGTFILGAYIYFQHNELSQMRLLIPIALTLPAMLVIRIEQGVVLGKGMMGPYNKSESLPRTLLLIVTLILWAMHAITLETSLWALAGTFALAAIYLLYETRSLGIARRLDPILTRKILFRGLLFLPGVILMIASRRVSILMLQGMSGPEATGIYFGVVRISETITEIALAIGIVIFSHNVRAVSTEQAVADAAKVTRSMMLVLLSMCVVLFAGAHWIVPVALGKEFVGQEVLFRVALIATWIGSLWIILYPSLSALASPIVSFWVFLPGVAVNVLLTYLLVPRYGVNGAGYALLTTQVVLSASFLFTFKLLFKARVVDFLVPNRRDIDGPLKAIRRRLQRRAKPA